jgi:hypothetical protein
MEPFLSVSVVRARRRLRARLFVGDGQVAIRSNVGCDIILGFGRGRGRSIAAD